MGNYFENVVVPDASAEEAPRLAAHGLDWLVAEGIVHREAVAGCVFGAPAGHLPGPQWAPAVTDPRIEPLGGVAVHAGPWVSHAIPVESRYVICPHCAAPTRSATDDGTPVKEVWDLFGPAFGVWEKTGAAMVPCGACGRTGDVAAWRWSDDDLVLAHLGFAFWDWPDLAPEFVAEFGKVLGGGRLIRMGGKL
ncbi:hypothetical protein [Streptomyces sp. NPDC004267]|uniref:hypothetical protein n=1 Tax=Streptomyces sp. NPDC004267 TaxID=3364694 RepID=UPI0036C50C26